MLKTSLPVVILRNNILFPKNEIKLEFGNELSKNIMNEAEFFHDGNLLVTCTTNALEETFQKNDLLKVGVICKIIRKIDLPNGNTRVILRGISRALIEQYLNVETDEIIESIISFPQKIEIPKEKEEVYIHKLLKELEEYIDDVPSISNSFLTDITSNSNLEEVTDLIVPNLPVTQERLLEYLKELNSIRRFEMILEDIYKEKEKFSIERNIDLKVQQGIESHQREYVLREKLELLKEELGDTSLLSSDIQSLKESLSKLDAPKTIIKRIAEEIQKYEWMNSSFESSIVRNYIDCLLNLPWNKVTKDKEDLKEVLSSLDSMHYGMEEVKNRIIEYLAIKKVSKTLSSPVICLVGPPGTGKTTLAYSIAKSLDRNFVKISLGGVNDPAEIIGHRRTYLGAAPGKIIQGMKKAKSSNPVFLIDEIDKMTSNIKGDPANALLEVLDPIQNKHFSDLYLEEEYDLSNVIFIVTANKKEDIPFPLRDRLEMIELNGYTVTEKLEICKNHILPTIFSELELNNQCIEIEDATIYEVIRYYTKEAGVRELQRQIAKIIRKIVKVVLLNNIKVNSVKVTVDNIEKYLGPKKFVDNFAIQETVGKVSAISYTLSGASLFSIETTYFKGTGNLVVTGTVGSMFKEAAFVALNYIRANSDKFGIPIEQFLENDIHVHVGNLEISKDGPSAGLAIATSIISSFTKKKISTDITMTGEITLLGEVLSVGNILEKIEGAIHYGMKTIFIPSVNEKELQGIPQEFIDKIEIILVDNYEQIFKKLGDKNGTINGKK